MERGRTEALDSLPASLLQTEPEPKQHTEPDLCAVYPAHGDLVDLSRGFTPPPPFMGESDPPADLGTILESSPENTPKRSGEQQGEETASKLLGWRSKQSRPRGGVQKLECLSLVQSVLVVLVWMKTPWLERPQSRTEKQSCWPECSPWSWSCRGSVGALLV
jgi:hypothetical protein